MPAERTSPLRPGCRSEGSDGEVGLIVLTWQLLLGHGAARQSRSTSAAHGRRAIARATGLHHPALSWPGKDVCHGTGSEIRLVWQKHPL